MNSKTILYLTLHSNILLFMKILQCIPSWQRPIETFGSLVRDADYFKGSVESSSVYLKLVVGRSPAIHSFVLVTPLCFFAVYLYHCQSEHLCDRSHCHFGK